MGGIACEADGGCSHCASELIGYLKTAFPEHAETFKAVFASEFGEDD